MPFKYNSQPFHIQRYPATNNKSLQAWSAADEHLLKHLDNKTIPAGKLALINDRYGYLHCQLHSFAPLCIIQNHSQQKAHCLNLKANQLSIHQNHFINPLQTYPTRVEIALIHIPKSLDLFRLYLYYLNQNTSQTGQVICAFMTRNFTPQLLSIAKEFFEEVEQSRAWKKSRLLLLTKKRPVQECSLINHIPFTKNHSLQQYFGVFSAGNIDYASRFLMDHLQVKKSTQCALDLASGNGVLALAIREQHPHCQLHLLDDSWLAIASSKLNISDSNTFFHWNHNLDDFANQSFDLIISNPPFHFEYEIDVSIALGLFKSVKRCLKPNGCFQLVANRHLNYKIHLDRIFDEVKTLAENNKFVVYNCRSQVR